MRETSCSTTTHTLLMRRSLQGDVNEANVMQCFGIVEQRAMDIAYQYVRAQPPKSAGVGRLLSASRDLPPGLSSPCKLGPALPRSKQGLVVRPPGPPPSVPDPESDGETSDEGEPGAPRVVHPEELRELGWASLSYQPRPTARARSARRANRGRHSPGAQLPTARARSVSTTSSTFLTDRYF